MKAHCYFIIFILLFSVSGCETEVKNVNVPEFEQKLVIAGFLSPSENISHIRVTSNQGIYGKGNRNLPVGKLTGSLSDGVNEVLLDADSAGLFLDHNKMSIEYGKTYHLKINSDRGLSAEATCTVPQKHSFIIQADTFSIPENFEWTRTGRRLDLRISIKDIPGEENYYRLDVSARGFTRGYYNQWSSQELIVPDNLISDKKLDGQDLIRSTDSGINYFMDFDTSYAIVYLYNTERSYYLYHKSLQDYHKTRGPFAEPTPVFSNIKGGLGIFTSYTLDSAVFRLK